jgi:hypothetical protein
MEKCGSGIQYMNIPGTQYCRSDNKKSFFLQGSAPGGYPHVAAAGSAPGSYPRGGTAAAARASKNEQKKKKKIVLAANFAAFGNQ